MALLTPVSLANISAINSALASEHSVVEESSAPTASRIALRASAPSLGDAVEESSAPAARSAVHARAPSLGDSDDDFAPLDPNDNDPYSWFNPTLPNDFLNPSVYPGEDVMTRLYRMIGVMENNPGNKTMARAFLLYVSNLINGGYVKPGSDIEKYLTSLNSNGKSIVDALIDLEIKQKFFYEYPNNPNWDPTGFFNYLQSLFGGSSTLGQDAQHYIADWKSRWTNFVQSNTYWNAKDNKMEAIYTYDWAQIYASGDWGSFIQNANVSGVQHDMRMNMIDSLMRQYSANPIFLVYLLLFLLTESSSIDDLAGLGTQAKWYQKQLPVIQDLGNTWQQGKFASADDAYNWIDKIENFVARTEANPYGKDLKDSIESSLGQGGLLGMQTTYTDANGKPLTIDDLYRNPDATAKDANGKQISYKDALFNSLNSWQLDPAGSSQPSPNYGAIQNDFKSADSAFTNIASTTSTKSSQVSNSIQATDSQLKSGLDSFLDQEKAAVNNQIARGSTL
jgi:hypothetical protein